MLALLLGTLALTSCSQQAQGPTQGDAGSADEVVATHQLGFEAFNLRDPAGVRRLLERRPDLEARVEELRSRLGAQGVEPAQTLPPSCTSAVSLHRSWPLGNPYTRHRVSCSRAWIEGEIAAEILNHDTGEQRRNHRVLWYASSGVVDSGTIPYRAGNYYCGYADGILWFDQWVMYPAGSPACGTL